jgi:hypothetical protein
MSFDDIKWGNRELEVLPDDELFNLNRKKLVSQQAMFDIRNKKKEDGTFDEWLTSSLRKAGLKNVETGHIQRLGKSGIGGRTVTQKKLDKIYELNKTKRKLTDEEVIEMKELYRNDITIGMDELAIKYSIDKVAVHGILNNKTYKDIGGTVTIRPAQLICERCGTHTNKSNYVRWHGEKCRNKK